MNYAETQLWNKSGSFSGGGVGIGTGGIGAGMGGGSYSENGAQQSKRASVFDEPEVALKPVMGVVIVGSVLAAIYSAAPDLIGSLAANAPGSSLSPNMSQSLDGLLSILKYVMPIASLGVFYAIYKRARENHEDNERALTVDKPQLLARYNELKYCESCHTLFDNQGRAEDANSIGFDKLLSLS